MDKMSITKRVLTITVLVSALAIIQFTATGCGCDCGDGNGEEFPQHILDKADQLIISKVGADYFKEYISYAPTQSKIVGSDYDFTYYFAIPGKEYVREFITFTLDSLGNPAANRDIIGIPNCLEKPGECEFTVDEAAARSIAEKNGMDKGIDEWKVIFKWEKEYDRYVWHILNYYSKSEGSQGFRGNGKSMYIDANNGTVLKFSDWFVR